MLVFGTPEQIHELQEIAEIVFRFVEEVLAFGSKVGNLRNLDCYVSAARRLELGPTLVRLLAEAPLDIRTSDQTRTKFGNRQLDEFRLVHAGLRRVIEDLYRLHGRTSHGRIGRPAVQLLRNFEKHAMVLSSMRSV
jgi:hypothetical protein